jgi:hypothetical protein
MKWQSSSPGAFVSSADVKVTALLTLPAAGTSVTQRLAAAFHAALLGERYCEQSCRIQGRPYHALL